MLRIPSTMIHTIIVGIEEAIWWLTSESHTKLLWPHREERDGGRCKAGCIESSSSWCNKSAIACWTVTSLAWFRHIFKDHWLYKACVRMDSLFQLVSYQRHWRRRPAGRAQWVYYIILRLNYDLSVGRHIMTVSSDSLIWPRCHFSLGFKGNLVRCRMYNISGFSL